MTKECAFEDAYLGILHRVQALGFSCVQQALDALEDRKRPAEGFEYKVPPPPGTAYLKTAKEPPFDREEPRNV